MDDKEQIICFHGFLGEKEDYDFLGSPVKVIEIFNDEFLVSYDEFPKRLSTHKGIKFPSFSVGYSLGGRLLLHALIKKPELFKKAVIISAHTGLKNETEKNQRIADDQRWSNLFKTNYDLAIKEWNEQKVFAGHSLLRNRKKITPQAIEHAFSSWSLGNQNDLTKDLSAVQTPILWIVGQKDEKFVSIATEACSILPNACLHIVKDCGHRVMWENPKKTANIIREFLA